MGAALFRALPQGAVSCYKQLMKHIVNIAVLGLAAVTVGPLAFYTTLALVKAFPGLCFVGTTVFAAAALDAAKVNA